MDDRPENKSYLAPVATTNEQAIKIEGVDVIKSESGRSIESLIMSNYCTVGTGDVHVDPANLKPTVAPTS